MLSMWHRVSLARASEEESREEPSGESQETMPTGALCRLPQLLAAAPSAPKVLFLLLLPLLVPSWTPGLSEGCRTEHFPVPSHCGTETAGGALSLPWVVTVRVEALTDVQEPEDLLPCPSVFQHEASLNGSAHLGDSGGRGPDSFFGHVARVAVTHKLTSTCAGAVVTARHVLTAAHCLFASRYKPTYRVFFRNGTSSAHGRHGHLHVGFPATAALCHPGCRFHGTTRAVNDLAVLLLAEPVDIYSSGQGAVCLPWPDVDAHGAVLWMARHEGRPKGGSGSSRLPTTLTREAVQLVNCSLLPHTAHDHAVGAEPSNELCTVSSGVLRDVADPGTALMLDTVHGWVLVGLLSWLDEAKAASASVAVFTDVRALMPWLLETIFKTF